MSTNAKNIAKAGLAGVAAGISLGAATVLLSDKKRREELTDKAKTMKDHVVANMAKMREEKEEEIDLVATQVGKAAKDEQEKASKSLN